MRARVPGSTSNLGPGFDVLGLALDCHLEVEVVESDHLSLHAEGEGAELPADATHLAARVVASVTGSDRFRITIRSEIPLGRGLGSSAALVAATAAAAGAPDPLAVAGAFDGHAENAAASVLGGLVAATFVDGAVVARRLPLDERLAFVALIPDRELATKTARGVLAETVPFADAVFNLGRLGLLLSGLSDRTNLVAAAGEDRLHQNARAVLYPEAARLLQALTEAGATVACWSGAGPTLLGICLEEAEAASVATAGEQALEAVGLSGRALMLRPDLDGLVISS